MGVSIQRRGAGVAAYAGMAAAPAGLNQGPRAALARAIESQVVPRLLVRRAPYMYMPAMETSALDTCVPEPAAPEPLGAPVNSLEVMDLATLAIGDDPHALRGRIQEISGARGMETICLDLLAPAARYLGALWDEDLCSFTDVTIGLLRLQDALHGVTAELEQGGADGFRRHRIVLAAAPGDQHTFGLSMVSSFFQKAGWCVTTLHESTLPDLGALLRREWVGVLGFSVGSEARLDRLAAVMPRLRDMSRNVGLSIMVGGPIFAAFPHLAAQIGADGTASDGVQATWVAENLLAEKAICG
jgi:methanogenic corrinoid protein MtbC1